MANQPKSVKQLESEFQAVQDAAKKIENELARAKKLAADRAERAKKAAEKRARKVQNIRKAEFENIKIDYEDVLLEPPVVVKKVSVPSSKPEPTAPKQPTAVATVINPAPKQEEKTGLLAWLNQKI